MIDPEKKSPPPADALKTAISMDLAMQSIPLPVLVMDKEGRVAFLNRAAVKTFGWAEKELLGREVVDALTAPGRRDLSRRELQRALDGESLEQLGMIRCADGSILNIAYRLSPLRDEQDWIHGVIALIEPEEGSGSGTLLPQVETVQLRRHEARQKALQNRIAAAEVSNILSESPFLDRISEMIVERMGDTSRLRGDFLATMSHELRTPLHAILGYAGLLQEGAFGELPEASHEPLTRIERRAHELHDLITNTLSLSRLEIEGESLNVDPVAVETLLTDLVQDAQRLRDQGETQVGLDVAPDLPIIETDVSKLKIVVRNLINNAIKFTDKGAIRVIATQNVGGVSIQVQDSGVGMTSEEIEHLFNAYTQNDTGRARGGVGLGLYIVQQLTHQLGGQVDAESTLGSGSTFRINLPLRPPTHDQG
jgi:PAS domain S-box-containing protein